MQSDDILAFSPVNGKLAGRSLVAPGTGLLSWCTPVRCNGSDPYCTDCKPSLWEACCFRREGTGKVREVRDQESGQRSGRKQFSCSKLSYSFCVSLGLFAEYLRPYAGLIRPIACCALPLC